MAEAASTIPAFDAQWSPSLITDQEKMKVMDEFLPKRESFLNANDEIATDRTVALLQVSKVPKLVNNETRGSEISFNKDSDEPRDLAPQNSSRVGSEGDNASTITLRPMSGKRSSLCSQNASQSVPRTKVVARTMFQMIPRDKTCVCVIL